MSYSYKYHCTNGHDVASPRPVETCPACVRGKPCDGELVPTGRKPKVVAS